jgi:hypothetical protein
MYRVFTPNSCLYDCTNIRTICAVDRTELYRYRHYDLNYTIDLYCGLLKFRHAVGFLICAVGLKFINTAVLEHRPRSIV